jgi:hypothetical protein
MRHMKWHKEGIHETWKILDMFDADFASDARNVRFGLAIDDFDPFSINSTPYSCWPIFTVLYNLPTSFFMKFEFRFLCLIIPVTSDFKPKSIAHSTCAQESSLHIYHTENGYRITNVTIYNIFTE